MKQIRKSQFLPWLLLLVGLAFYVYYGVSYNAWMHNLPNLVIYILIILALFWALRKQDSYRNRDGNN